jgi:hypothetical protein
VVTLERMLGCPRENLEFPLWYLKQRGWIERLESGYLAISADGIDKLGSDDLSLPANRLLEDKSMSRADKVDGPLRLEGMAAAS